MLATHQTLRSKTPHSPHPPALTVSLLECTKDRANGDGTESQILLNCQGDPNPNPPVQAFPGAADWDVLRETVLVLQITQEQKPAIRAKAEKSCELPYVWSIPRLTGLKEILGMNWIHFSTSEKDCICTLLCQRDSVKETHFKNLFKQSL